MAFQLQLGRMMTGANAMFWWWVVAIAAIAVLVWWWAASNRSARTLGPRPGRTGEGGSPGREGARRGEGEPPHST
ncbi:MAG: hypothetical protein IRZ11_00835 [Clostridia bacterium]|nr:hypothetical protein [Clostridia bacterium]